MNMRVAAIAAGLILAATAAQSATLIAEGFDNVSTLAASGWVLTNNSVPVGNDWFQGDNLAAFSSQAGAANSYIADNFNATSSITGMVDSWLISPILALSSGGTLSFYTRTADPGFGDVLEVRFNASAASGTSSFSTLLRTVGDATTPYSSSGWQLITVALPTAATGRFAFRYTVADAENADYIGIDTVTVSAVPEPETFALIGLGLMALSLRRRRASS